MRRVDTRALVAYLIPAGVQGAAAPSSSSYLIIYLTIVLSISPACVHIKRLTRVYLTKYSRKTIVYLTKYSRKTTST